MMNHTSLRSLCVIAVLLFVAGCSLPAGAGPGPRAWIDDPLDGVTLPLGPVVVQSHASSAGGTASAALLVNGAQARVDNATNASDRLASFAQPWAPAGPGDYTLEVVATDPAGNIGRSNLVLVHIGAVVVTPTSRVGDVAPVPPLQAPPSFTPSATSDLTPRFRFTINANCRQGPGTVYEPVTSFYAGDLVTIEGRNEDSSWYWVLIPNSKAHCAVSASTGVTVGHTDNVPFMPAPALPPVVQPPTVQAKMPPPFYTQPFTLTAITSSCTPAHVVHLEWRDGLYEEGYRIYRDYNSTHVLIATLPPDSTSYDDYPPDLNSHQYAVEAYNISGVTVSPEPTSSGCTVQ